MNRARFSSGRLSGLAVAAEKKAQGQRAPARIGVGNLGSVAVAGPSLGTMGPTTQIPRMDSTTPAARAVP